MIYNLTAYLKEQFPLIQFIVNSWTVDSKETSILVSETGGDVSHYTGRRDVTIQFLTRSKNNWEAKKLSDSVYSKLFNRFGVTFPEVVIDDTTFPEIKSYRIVPIQAPYFLGVDKSSYNIYTFNVIVTLDYI